MKTSTIFLFCLSHVVKQRGGAKLTTDLWGSPSDTCAGFRAGFCICGHGCAEALAITTSVTSAGVCDTGLIERTRVHLGERAYCVLESPNQLSLCDKIVTICCAWIVCFWRGCVIDMFYLWVTILESNTVDDAALLFGPGFAVRIGRTGVAGQLSIWTGAWHLPAVAKVQSINHILARTCGKIILAVAVIVST